MEPTGTATDGRQPLLDDPQAPVWRLETLQPGTVIWVLVFDRDGSVRVAYSGTYLGSKPGAEPNPHGGPIQLFQRDGDIGPGPWPAQYLGLTNHRMHSLLCVSDPTCVPGVRDERGSLSSGVRPFPVSL